MGCCCSSPPRAPSLENVEIDSSGVTSSNVDGFSISIPPGVRVARTLPSGISVSIMQVTCCSYGDSAVSGDAQMFIMRHPDGDSMFQYYEQIRAEGADLISDSARRYFDTGDGGRGVMDVSTGHAWRYLAGEGFRKDMLRNMYAKQTGTVMVLVGSCPEEYVDRVSSDWHTKSESMFPPREYVNYIQSELPHAHIMVIQLHGVRSEHVSEADVVAGERTMREYCRENKFTFVRVDMGKKSAAAVEEAYRWAGLVEGAHMCILSSERLSFR